MPCETPGLGPRPEAPFGIDVLETILPHRRPMLMLDRVEQADAETVVASKRLPADAVFFQGHFPDRPVVPGVLLVEAMAQASLVLYYYNFDPEELLFLTKDKSRFYKPVPPEATIRIVVTKIRYLKMMGMGKGEVFVGDDRVAASEMSFAGAGAAELMASLGGGDV